jgi:hypothetical protein
MSQKKPDDDIAFDETGAPFAIGADAAAGEADIVDDPASKPVLIVAMRGDDLGVRVFGSPSEEVADLLDHIAATYRKAVNATKGTRQ